MARYTHLLIVLILLNLCPLLQGALKAQHIITLDLLPALAKGGDVVKPPRNTVPMDETVSLRLENVNPFVYQVTINGKSIEIYSEPNGQLGKLFNWKAPEKPTSIAGSGDDDPAPPASRDGETPVKEVKPEEKKLKEQFTSIEERRHQFVRDEIDLRSQLVLVNFGISPELTDSQRTKIDELRAQLAITVDSLNESKRERAEIAKKANISAYKLLLQDLKDQGKLVDRYYLDLRLVGAHYLNLKTHVENSCLTQQHILNAVKTMEEKAPFDPFPQYRLLALNQSLDDMEASIDEYLRSPAVLDHFDRDIGKAKESVTKFTTAVKSMREEVKNGKYDEVFRNMLQLRTALEDDMSFVIISPPQQADQDIIEFEVSVKPRDNASTATCGKPEYKFTYDVHTIKGWVVHWGTGPQFGVGEHDEVYSLTQPDTAGMVMVKQRDNKNLVRPVLGASMHFFKRNAGHGSSWGGMFGVGIDGTDIIDDMTFFAGPCLIFGRSPMISIQAGLRLSQMDRLKTDLEVGTSYSSDDLKSDALTEKELKPSGFVGISLVFPKKR